MEENQAEASSSNLLIQRLSTTAITPSRSTPHSIGYDLHLDSTQDVTLSAGSIQALPTGIAIECPYGTYGRIAPRSGLTLKQNLTTMAGVIDPDYRAGELKIVLHNFGKVDQHLQPGQAAAIHG